LKKKQGEEEPRNKRKEVIGPSSVSKQDETESVREALKEGSASAVGKEERLVGKKVGKKKK